MRFFVPSVTDLQQAEAVYRNIREHVAATIGSVSDKRIYGLKYSHDGHPSRAVVGSDNHPFGRVPVVAIFEGLNGAHYVCTQKGAASEVEPHPVPQHAVLETEEFSALA